jgi:microcystin-dependent protein
VLAQPYTPGPVELSEVYLDDELNRIAQAMSSLGGGAGAAIPGALIAWATDTPPPGWLLCDGALLLVDDYPDLAEVLGALYGGDGVVNFGLPDYRGEFLRGRDGGRGADPEAGGRVGGDAAGSTQGGQHQAHTHAGEVHGHTASTSSQFNHVDANTHGVGVYGNGPFGQARNTYSTTVNNGGGGPTGSAGGAETRPRNIYVNWIINAGG